MLRGVATPCPESDLDDEQIRALLLYCRSEKQMRTDRSFYHSVTENLMSSSFQDPKSTGRPVALFSCKNRLNQETFTTEKIFPQNINRFGKQ